ncbi:queuosine precursor transporter [Moheibacter sediminis]|uniref:Probable queuosine precursor transporter n=1 Tax=Moheibacter sediminis TaxID=1434700 RepID=A0A1W2C0F5_9FLAO|nr:queuosine precursor transporter [Moheibacter sediminis]SMC78392.1 hypothetical protein SAMN06296427_10821 [Moheibacter sediminis]
MTFKTKESRLLIILSAFFVANTVLSEFIGVKIFSVERTFGFEPVNWELFGVKDLSFNMSAGSLTWPLVFIMTDIINEYFGVKQVKFLSVMTAALILFLFGMTWISIQTIPADFWVNEKVDGQDLNMHLAFNKVFGQGMWIIFGSLTAFIIGQILDVYIFHKIKKVTGEKKLWLRATGSTVVSQLIDSFVVAFIAFYLNPAYDWTWQTVLAICLVGYIYKFTVAVLLTPLLYIIHKIVDTFLGKDLSQKLLKDAQS